MKNKIFNLLFLSVFLIISCNDEEPVSSCNDGIQNGSEMAVDCGGDCSPCPSCIDGQQNGNETGVDCGGTCTSCIILGCTDPNAHNYDPNANQDSGSCETCSDGIFNGDEEGLDCGGTLCDPCPQVGDIGPAGGLVFYDQGSYTNGWRYLEYGIEIQGGDKQWGCRSTNNTSLFVGTGFNNTANVINNYNTGTCDESPDAFLACANLQWNGFSDWYLPSVNELQELYPYRSSLALGVKRYWSSSESTASFAFIVDYGGEDNGVPFSYTWAKIPVNGDQGLGAVVAIRRF